MPGYQLFRLHNFRIDQKRSTIARETLFIARKGLIITISPTDLGNSGNERREFANMKNVSDFAFGVSQSEDGQRSINRACFTSRTKKM